MKIIHKINKNYDLTALVTVFDATPDLSTDALCQFYIELGDGTDDLSAVGGNFTFELVIGGQTLQPESQVIIFGTQVRASVWTSPFPVPKGKDVTLKVLSPNAADTDVDITATLYDVGAVQSVHRDRDLLVTNDGGI